jgi:hypothetical protein
MGQTSYSNIPGGAARAPFGGRTIYIKTVPYRAMNWQPKSDTREVARPDANGDDAEFMLRKGPRRQSGLTLQLASRETPIPPEFEEFTVDGARYVVIATTEARPEGDFWTCEIDYRSVSTQAQLAQLP